MSGIAMMLLFGNDPVEEKRIALLSDFAVLDINGGTIGGSPRIARSTVTDPEPDEKYMNRRSDYNWGEGDIFGLERGKWDDCHAQ